jgi:hypothetical protein
MSATTFWPAMGGMIVICKDEVGDEETSVKIDWNGHGTLTLLRELGRLLRFTSSSFVKVVQ